MKSIPGPWMMVLLAVILAGCSRTARDQDSASVSDSSTAVTSPKPQTPTQPRDCKLPTRPADLKACTRELHFDELELAGDQQRLRVCRGGTCRYGPLATIQPETSSYEGDLNTGRIIARMFLNRGERERYDKLGLAPGDTTYWWVQKSPSRNEGKSYYLTVSGDSLVKKSFTLEFQPYVGLAPRQALARWLWVEDDETTQGGCPSGTCK
jgi:hypothetical protein